MDYVFESRKNDCKNCYKCIRVCPTKSISFKDNQASILHDDCILCGACYLACPQGAKAIRDDRLKVQKLLQGDEPVYVSVAPSYAAQYPESGFSALRKVLIALGFADAEETAVGATIVKKAYDAMLQKGDRDVVISSCCHSINLLIQKHYSALSHDLADVLSPMLAHGQDLKKRYPGAKVVFIGPCIAKKDEADHSPYVDAVLTFLELERWLDEAKLTVAAIKDPIPEASKARLFPISGGILQTMEKPEGYTYLAVDGVENCIAALKDIASGTIHHCFIEMSACPGSCINGPAIAPHARALVGGTLAVKRSAGSADFKVSETPVNQLKRPFNGIVVTRAVPDEAAIAACLKEMGKTEKDKELNCGSCGYNSCRDKAIAILQGKAVKEMCLPFLMEKAKSFSNTIVMNTPNGLMVLDEDLKIQLMNQALCRMVGIRGADVMTGQAVTALFDPELFAGALSGLPIHGKRVYLAAYDKYVDLTVVYDAKFHALVCILRDITDEQRTLLAKEALVKQSIAVTDRVIAKNMRAVQEIASLLGETAAETKAALSGLQRSLKDDE